MPRFKGIFACSAFALSALAACGGGGQSSPNPGPTPTQNLAADAGSDVSGSDVNYIALKGKASGGDGSAIAYQWKQLSGTPVAIESANAAEARFFPPALTAIETLDFELAVTQGSQKIVDAVRVTVTPAAPQVSPKIVTKDYLVGTYGDTVTLDASKSVDPDGRIVSYRWVLLPGQSQITLQDAETSVASFRVPDAPSSRSASVVLEVVDDSGLTDQEIVFVEFNPRVSSTAAAFETFGARFPSPGGTSREGNFYHALNPNIAYRDVSFITLPTRVVNTGGTTLSAPQVKVRLNASRQNFANAIVIDQFGLPAIASGQTINVADTRERVTLPSNVSGLYVADACVESDGIIKCNWVSSDPLKLLGGRLVCGEDPNEETWLGTTAPAVPSMGFSGALCYDDNDRYTLSVEAGKTYSLFVYPEQFIESTEDDVSLQLESESGAIIAEGVQANTSGTGPARGVTLKYQATSTSSVRIVVKKRGSGPNAFHYRVVINTTNTAPGGSGGATELFIPLDIYTLGTQRGNKVLVVDGTLRNSSSSSFSGSVTQTIRLSGPFEIQNHVGSDYTNFMLGSFQFSGSLAPSESRRVRTKVSMQGLDVVSGRYVFRGLAPGFAGTSLAASPSVTLGSGAYAASLTLD